MKPSSRDRQMDAQLSIDHITDSLSITSIKGARRRSTAAFDRVISVCQDVSCANIDSAVPYEHYPLADDAESQSNWGGSYDYEMFAVAAESVLTSLGNERVLVHCHVGRNRSAAVCAAALAVHTNQTFGVALNIVADARPMVDPNDVMRSHGRQFVSQS